MSQSAELRAVLRESTGDGKRDVESKRNKGKACLGCKSGSAKGGHCHGWGIRHR